MIEELAKLRRDLPTVTVLYLTHDQSEALTLADRIAILRDGRLTAFGHFPIAPICSRFDCSGANPGILSASPSLGLR
jgi:ABC-type multidrug transport system ATPase subunit